MGVLTGCSIVRIFFTIIISLFIVIIIIMVARQPLRYSTGSFTLTFFFFWLLDRKSVV